VRAIWESLYGIDGLEVNSANAAINGVTPPRKLPVFAKDGTIMPPAGGPR